MDSISIESLFSELVKATKPSQVANILKMVGDSSDAQVDEEFGELNLCWRFYGNNESNMSTINLASKPERSIVERITNAIDAVLERKNYESKGITPSTPMDAAKIWFGRPPSTNESGIFSWKNYQTEDHDKHIHVVLLDGDYEEYPSLDILDRGIGINGVDFPKTILSLQAGNKLTKKHLAGAFGQGGASSLAFCKYTLIVSRHIDKPEKVNFTVVKLMNLPDDWKYNAYVYLAIKNKDEFSIPVIDQVGHIDLYSTISNDASKKIPYEVGTLVRSFGYSLEKYKSTLNPGPGNLYHLLHYLMFDPLLPFRVVDFRSSNPKKNELITGSRNRLMRLVKDDDFDSDGGNIQLRHYSPIELVSPLGSYEPSIKVEYWVVFHYKKATSGEKNLRSSSTEFFVDRYHPFIGTLNGQNQGELTASLLKRIGLTLVARHLIVHIDASYVDKDVRQSLFASTREGFKEDRVLEKLIDVITNRLKEDERLIELEKELEETILIKKSSEEDEVVRNEITKLLSRSGYDVKVAGTVDASGEGEKDNEITPKVPIIKKPFVKLPPLPTLDYPEVTRFEIVYPPEILYINIGDNRIIRIETNANFRFDREKRIALRFESESLEVASKSILQDGRMNWRVRTTNKAVVGEVGEIIASITKPNGEQLNATLLYEIFPPREIGGKTKGKVPPFSIQKIDPYDESEKEIFGTVWSYAQIGDIPNIAYKTFETGGILTVFYSSGFRPYRAQVEKLKTTPSLANLFEQNYKIWIVYHAILQHQKNKESELSLLEDENEIRERQRDVERSLVAEMQVKQAFANAEIRLKLSGLTTSDE